MSQILQPSRHADMLQAEVVLQSVDGIEANKSTFNMIQVKISGPGKPLQVIFSIDGNDKQFSIARTPVI